MNQRVAHGAGNGNEAGYPRAILETSARNKSHAARNDQRYVPEPDERGQRQGVRAGIVGVHEVGSPGSYGGPNAPRGGHIPVGAHAHRAGRLARTSEPPDERGVGLTHDERFITTRALPLSEQGDLSLPAAPFAAAVDVQHTQGHVTEAAA